MKLTIQEKVNVTCFIGMVIVMILFFGVKIGQAIPDPPPQTNVVQEYKGWFKGPVMNHKL